MAEDNRHFDYLAEEQPPDTPYTILDMLLYPISTTGVLCYLFFLGALLLWGILERFLIPPLVGPMYWRFVGIVPALFFAYILYYLLMCIQDSAVGGRRAPETLTTGGGPDLDDLRYGAMALIGPLLLCFLPGTLYAIFRGRDILFWTLMGVGTFFFPMILLAVTLWDSPDAYNPWVWIRAIFVTNVRYLFILLGFVGVAAWVYLAVLQIGNRDFLSAGWLLCFFPYPMMIYAHLLGRFYYWNQERLDWEI